MIDSVAGAMVSAMPMAMSIMRQTMSGQYAAVDASSDAQRARAPTVTQRQAGRDDELRADAVDEPRAQRRDDHHASRRMGRKRTPVSNGV